ncbi:hypothetical protein [Archangium violaceum]|uniref:hypothetical protein n=1 Tax=Archangium violaceum TaxID=83451 RepID=UPI0036DA03DF
MKSTLRTIGTYACAMALATTFAACTKTVAPITDPPNASAEKTPFPGGASITPRDLTATYELPHEPPPYDPSLSRQEFARFAWRQFIYLNSPARPNPGDKGPAGAPPVIRAEIDRSRNFASSGDPNFYQSGTGGNTLGRNHLIWETFAHRSELFPVKSPPTGALQYLYPQYALANISVGKELARFNNLDETTQIGQNQIFFPRNDSKPSPNPYDDHMILFEAKVNHVEYNYIRNTLGKTYPSTTELPRHIEFPPNKGNSDLPAGASSDEESIEVKAAWREMSDGLIKSGRYHTAEALYYVNKSTEGAPSGSKIVPRVGTFGLVGLHILRKTKNYPAFIYTTFEHVDNLQKSGNPKDSTGLYVVTLYDTMNYNPSIKDPQAFVNAGNGQLQTFTLPTEGTVDLDHGYPIIPGSFNLPSGFAGPIKVGPSHAMTPAVQAVNDEVMKVMNSMPEFNNSVWKYYRLAGIQILPVDEDSPTVPVNNPGGLSPLTEDFYLANSVIESSQPGIQLFKGAVSDPGMRGAGKYQLLNERSMANIQQVRGLPLTANKVVMGGCMGCHGNAQYPRANGETGTGPTIFNFLTTQDTLSGKGFEVEVRPTSIAEVRKRTQVYMK